ncbi:MAG: hypothetical protein ABEJ86_04760 [Halococcoides sp.]
MPTVALDTTIDAPIDRVFDLARTVEIHTETMGHSETAVAGTTTGQLALGDIVTWRATHIGVVLHLTVKISAMDRPEYFRDCQVGGPFAELVHEHDFERLGPERTRMTDRFRFASPYGVLGGLVDSIVLKRYMRRLIAVRNRTLASIAERHPDDAVP